jgi:hypothetical protein
MLNTLNLLVSQAIIPLTLAFHTYTLVDTKWLNAYDFGSCDEDTYKLLFMILNVVTV